MIKLNDILGYKDLKIYQDDDFFAFSLDSIILANYAKIRLRDKKIVDFCSGNAVIPLVLSRRFDKKIEGIEIQKDVYKLGKKSIDYNNLSDKIQFYNDDIKNFCSKKNNQSKYDFVLCNPPYFRNDIKSLKNSNYNKMVARHEILINLGEICDCAKKILKDGGVFCLVHRAERLIEIISKLKDNNLEPKSIKLIYENKNICSSTVLIHAQKNGKKGVKIESPLIMFENDGTRTFEYEQLLKEVRR